VCVCVCVCVCARARARARACGVDMCRIMGSTLMDGVWVPLGTMERTSPSHHPSLSESFIAAWCIYEHISYIYIYIYLPHPTKNAPSQHTCMLHTQSPTSCPTNQDLSLLPTVTDATRARAPVYPTCSRDGWCIIFVVHVILHIHTFICFFT